ncbi:MAG TPA: CHAD domain-containing protein, partial [Acidimicrobiales bacterium]|nr:CHAD domain-containing protein [Acidimicrobiales bacterium]
MGVPELELPPGLTLGAGRTTRTTRHWLDTFDRRLLGKGREMWVEPAAEGAEARVVVDGWTAPWPLDLAPKVVRPAELPPAVADRLGDVLADRALVPLASAVVTESEHGVRDEEQKTVCRVLVQRAGAVRRVEVRPLRGYEKEEERVAAALGDSASPPDGRPALVRAVLDAAGATEAPGSGSAGTGLDPKAPVGVGVAQILGRLLDTVAANLEGTLGRYDDEFLHDLRVAVRRGRTALKIARGFVDPAPAELLAGELKWLGDMTTPARDLDVHLQDAPGMAAGVDEELRGHLQPFVDLLRAKQDQAYCDLAAALTSERFERLTADLPGLLSELQPPIEWENAVVTTDELARAALEKTFSRVVKRGRRLAPES